MIAQGKIKVKELVEFKKKILAVSFVMMLVMLCISPIFAKSKGNDLENEKAFSYQVRARGFEDEAIYYTYNNPYYYYNSSDFPSSISITERKGNALYSGTLRYTGHHQCNGSSCVGEYAGVLYFSRFIEFK